MAARLNVIMVHSPPATATAQRISESIVGELIGRPGIDVMLVGPLDQIHEGTTDQLSLESITSDVAVLDWRSPSELIQVLDSIGFAGSRWPHRHDSVPDSATPAGSPRKIFAYNLNEFTDAAELCAALAELLANRQVTTYSLASSLLSKPKPVGKQKATPAVLSTADTISPEATSVDASIQPPSPSTGEIDLEKLVDQLDEFDP